jgi:hypothetical protein
MTTTKTATSSKGSNNKPYIDSPTSSASGESSAICEIVTARNTCAMLSFTRRNGSRTVQVEL